MAESTAVGLSENTIDPASTNIENESYPEMPPRMSHQEALAYVEKSMQELIQSDPLIKYLPSEVTIDELNSLLALEHGRAITVVIKRADGETYSIVVEQKATVLDLKKAIQRHVTLKLNRERCGRTISWRYIWKTYWLYYENQKLTEDNKALKDYGIKNFSELCFIKRLKNK